MTARELSVLTALVGAVAPDGPPFDGAHRRVAERVASYVPAFPTLVRLSFRLGLVLLELGPWLFARTHRRLSTLPREAAARYVQGWIDSPAAWRRDVIKGYLSVCVLELYALPEVETLLGFPLTPWVEQQVARRRALGHDPHHDPFAPYRTRA